MAFASQQHRNSIRKIKRLDLRACPCLFPGNIRPYRLRRLSQRLTRWGSKPPKIGMSLRGKLGYDIKGIEYKNRIVKRGRPPKLQREQSGTVHFPIQSFRSTQNDPVSQCRTIDKDRNSQTLRIIPDAMIVTGMHLFDAKLICL